MITHKIGSVGDLSKVVGDAKVVRLDYTGVNVHAVIDNTVDLEFVGIPTRPVIVTCKDLHIAVHGGVVNGLNVTARVDGTDAGIIALWQYCLSKSKGEQPTERVIIE